MTRETATRAQSLGAGNDDQTQIAELVETAIDGNDLLPLVRLALEGQVDSGSPFSNNSTLETVSETVKNCLKKVIEEADTSAAVHSRANAGSISTALEELESIQKSAESLSQAYQTINTDIRTSGESLLVRWKEFAELQEMENTLLNAGRNLEWACTILQRCVDVSQNIDKHKLYQALNILEDIQEQTKEDVSATSEILQSFLREIMNDLRNIIQQMAVMDFNDWLVTARSEARQIGLQAIRQAAINRQHEDRCAQERKAVLEHIKSTHSLNEAMPLISSSFGTHDATSESSSRPAFQSMDVISISGTPTPSHHDDDHTSTLSERSGMTGSLFQPRSGGLPLMESTNKAPMSMRGLHRCIFVHKRLGKMAQFREYYMEQRRLQIDSDLIPPTNFLEVYQSYLAQVTGFFIVEDNVLRMTDDLIVQQDVDGFWEIAIVMLKSAVDSAFEGLNSAPAMLLVKDFLLLVCSGLSKSGYPAANLKEILSSNMGKYHALMNGHVSAQVNKIVRDDRMNPVKIKSKEMFDEYMKLLRLPDSIDPNEKPDSIPFVAPFTEMVPQLIYVIQEYVRDSIAYLKGLINPGDVLTTACQHRDKMLKVLFDSVQTQVTSMSYSDLSMRDSMQLVTNMWTLSKGLGALDEWTVRHFTGSSTSSNQPGTITRRPSVTASTECYKHARLLSMESGGNTYQIPMRGLDESCIRLVVLVASQEINRFLSLIRAWDFVPRTAPTAATSPLVEELIIYLQGVYDMGKQQMPRSASESVIQAVMHAAGSGFMDLLCGTAVPNINEYGFARLLEDLTALEKFAGHFSIAGLAKELTGPRQLCTFVVDGQGFTEDVPQIMNQLPNISIHSCISTLEKYRELGGWQTQRTSRRTAKRKEIDLLVKKLKDHIHQMQNSS